jgi:hypothetical protein
MLELEIFVFEFLPVNGFSASSVELGEVATLRNSECLYFFFLFKETEYYFLQFLPWIIKLGMLRVRG